MGVNALLAAPLEGVGLLFVPGAGVAGDSQFDATNSFREPFGGRQARAGPLNQAPHGADSPTLR